MRAITSVVNRYYDTTTGQFVSVDPDVNVTGQPYAYAGDDPVDGNDPLGLCNSGVANGYYPGQCATTGPEAIAAGQYIASHSGGGGFSFTNGFKAVADYGAGVANFAASTATFGQVHVSDPYCGFGWASDVGYGFGLTALGILGIGEADAAVEATDATENVTDVLHSPNFVVHPNGEIVPVPEGAVGPTPVETGKGFQFTGGSGGNGLDDSVTDIRIMDPVTSGKYSYPQGYVTYSNGSQTLNPWTGQTVSNADPWAHWAWS